MYQINLWGIKINPLTKWEIVNIIDKHIIAETTTFHLTGVNPETISKAQKDKDLKESINSSDIVNIDNMMVVLFLRLLRYKIPERVACPDVFEELLSLCNRKGYSIYFLGAKEEILQTMIKKVKIKYPNLRIVGARNGYFKPTEEISIVDDINVQNADMLFVAFPTPQKEKFINTYKQQIGVRFVFGVGGAFDVQAEKVKRAPLWMRKIGLEGTHRAIQNPGNYGTRYLIYYIPFVILFLKELLRKRPK